MGQTVKSAYSVAHKVLALRDSQSNSRGALARIRTGLLPETEHRAYGDILPLISPEASKTDQTAVLRVAALIAIHPNIAHIQGEKSFAVGYTMRQISTALAIKRGVHEPLEIDPGSPDNVAIRLSQIVEQEMEGAVLTIHRLLTLADDLDISVDFLAVMNLILRWGNGVSDSSAHIRSQILRDYYSYRPSKTKAK